MKILSIGCNNLCSAANDSFKTANNSSSVTVVKCGKKFDRLGGRGEGWTDGDWQGGAVFLQSSGNLLVTGLMDKTSYSHK